MYFLLTTSSRSFHGYASINSVLSEVRDPVRTIKLAAPLAVTSVAAVYFFINISYFAVVSKRDILESKRIVALVVETYCLIIFLMIYSTVYRALYFRNLFGPTTERVGFRYILHPRLLMSYTPKALSCFIALSTLGNLLTGQFYRGRGD